MCPLGMSNMMNRREKDSSINKSLLESMRNCSFNNDALKSKLRQIFVYIHLAPVNIRKVKNKRGELGP